MRLRKNLIVRLICFEKLTQGRIMKLEKSPWDGEGYYYLSKKDSDRYDEVKDSKDPKDIEIRELILDKARQSRAAHCASRH